jgi:hypothetical protein
MGMCAGAPPGREPLLAAGCGADALDRPHLEFPQPAIPQPALAGIRKRCSQSHLANLLAGFAKRVVSREHTSSQPQKTGSAKFTANRPALGMSDGGAADARIRAAAAAERRAGASRRPELVEPPPKRPKAKTNSQILEELGITDHQRDMECTLSHQIFDDPVIADDNHTYERAYIEGYFASCKGRVISPLTNEPLANTQLRPNLQLRKVVEAYVEFEVRKARARLGVSVAPLPTNDDDDDGVAIVGAVTRAERNLAGRRAAVDLTMDEDDEMLLPDGTRIDELGLDEAAPRPPKAPHAVPPAAPLPAPSARAAVPSVAMPAAASLPPGLSAAASTAAAAASSTAAAAAASSTAAAAAASSTAAAATSALPTSPAHDGARAVHASPAHDGACAVHASPAHDGALPTKRKVLIHVQRTHAPDRSQYFYSENGRLGKLKERYCEEEEGAGRPLPLNAVKFRFAGVLVEDAHTPLALGMALSPQINLLEVDEPSAAEMEGQELPNFGEAKACVAIAAASAAATAASAAAASAAAASPSAAAASSSATAAAAAPLARDLFTVADVNALVACMDHPIRKARQVMSSLREATFSRDLP